MLISIISRRLLRRELCCQRSRHDGPGRIVATKALGIRRQRDNQIYHHFTKMCKSRRQSSCHFTCRGFVADSPIKMGSGAVIHNISCRHTVRVTIIRMHAETAGTCRSLHAGHYSHCAALVPFFLEPSLSRISHQRCDTHPNHMVW